MTNFDRVKGYYKVFDEKNRLVNSGSSLKAMLHSMASVRYDPLRNRPVMMDSTRVADEQLASVFHL